MSVETYSPTQDAVIITPAAAKHFAKQLEKEHADAVRLSVKESGCTGFMYVMDLVNEPSDGDLVLDVSDQVKVFLDQKSLPVLQGTEVDYELEGVNRTIKFKNPNAKDHCGCGESFNI